MKRYYIDTSCECGRFGDDVNAIEDNDGDWVRFDDIEHLLQDAQKTAHNSDYAKCANEISELIYYNLASKLEIEKILKKHFA